MRVIDLLHRWAGGVLGLILAVLGLTGALLVHKEDWIALPHAGDVRIEDPVALGGLTAHLLEGASGGESLIYASDRFGLVQVRNGGSGLYATQGGNVVARWNSQWERPELWLFDLHHRLFAGDSGEVIVGIAGLAGTAFVVTGTILWRRTRRTFRFRLWPARMSGPAIRMHHRDLGIVMAPLLLLVALTGAMLIFRPVAGLVLAPISAPSVIEKELKAPKLESGPLAERHDWPGMIATAHRLYPDAQIRILSLPRNPGDPIAIRMKQPAEWLPNGRTMLWFDAASGALLAHRNALSLQPGTRAFNMVYPIHAAKVGGIAWRLVMTFTGLALTILGSLAVWSFWFKRAKLRAYQAEGIEAFIFSGYPHAQEADLSARYVLPHIQHGPLDI